MPHTINLVSQFEDVIRRSGTELESNITSVVRGGWIRKSGTRKKVTPHNWFQYDEDESPPPIPKRVPLAWESVPYSSLSPKSPNDRIRGKLLQSNSINDANEDKGFIFTIPDDEQRSVNSNFKYRDSKEIDKEATERLTTTPEDDIRSVRSYYKEEYKPTPSPRVSHPPSFVKEIRSQEHVRPSKPIGFSYLHPPIPPSPPLSSVASAVSSPRQSPQGGEQPVSHSSSDTKQNRNSLQNNFSLQLQQNNDSLNVKNCVSNENILQTGNQGTSSPFISRAASYNSAVGHVDHDHEEFSTRQAYIPTEQRQPRSSISSPNIVTETLSASNRGQRINHQPKKLRKNQPSLKRYKMHRSPSSADISTYDGCGEASKKLQLIANFILLTSSLVLIGTGAGLLGFYRIHMLEVVTPEFIIVPMVLVVGGITTLFAALFGFYVTMREDSCLMITYAVIMAIEFLVMVTGIVCTVDLLFIIQTGLFDSDVIPELTLYETDSWVRHKWDTMQREFTCCGGYGYATGYNDWKHTLLGGAHNSVPDSCCLNESPGCGANVFGVTDLRVTIQKIHLHGCLTIMMVRLESHVKIILSVFCGVGGIVAIIELLTIVLACCYANQIAKLEREEEWEYDPVHGHEGYAGGGYSNQHPQFSRPPSPGSTLRGCRPCDDKDVSSQHETAF